MSARENPTTGGVRDGDLSALLERAVRSLEASRQYVAYYESMHMSNVALDIHIENEAVCELLKSLIAEAADTSERSVPARDEAE